MKKYILVGVDGTPESQLALHWAVAAAEARGTAVRVVRAYLTELSRWPALGVEGYVPPPMPLDGFQRDLDAAVQYVRDRLGYEAGSGWLANSDAANALLSEAANAELVVVGNRSRNKMSAALVGSVGTTLAAKAPCPVVIVRGEQRDGRVVVGTDGSDESADAVTFAFEEAERLHQPLLVAYCWQPYENHIVPTEDARQLCKNALAESLAPYCEKFPRVHARADVVIGRPTDQLIRLSETASLVVVGSRGRGGVKGLLLGSVSQSLLHHAQSPVVIVRQGGES